MINSSTRGSEGKAPVSQSMRITRWLPWAAPGSWLQIRRAAVDAELAFSAAKARVGSGAKAASAAYKALTSETLLSEENDDGDAEQVRWAVDTHSARSFIESNAGSRIKAVPTPTRGLRAGMDQALGPVQITRDHARVSADLRVFALGLIAFGMLIALGLALPPQRNGTGITVMEVAPTSRDE